MNLEPLRVAVTGEHAEINNLNGMEVRGRRVEWLQVPVLEYEAVEPEESFWNLFSSKAFEWVIFTSPRAIQFWNALLKRHTMKMPTESQVACIGETTAECASEFGMIPDFYPLETGSENFLKEFEELLSYSTHRPTVLLLHAENGRKLIEVRLKEIGCKVQSQIIYRSVPRKQLSSEITAEILRSCSLLLFTSPSSYEALATQTPFPEGLALGAIGSFTQEHLHKKGVESKLLPEGRFERVGEIL